MAKPEPTRACAAAPALCTQARRCEQSRPRSVRSPYCLLSRGRRPGTDDELAEGAVVLHVVVRPADVLQRVDVNWPGISDAVGDAVEVGLQDLWRQVVAAAAVGSQPDATR